MMWNWLASALASEATIVLYDGSPLHPGPEVLWQMAADEGVTIFGTSPRYLASLEKAGYQPRERHGLAVLRTLLSTGSPLGPEQYDFVAVRHRSRRAARFDLRRHGHRLLLRARQSAPARVSRRAAVPRARHEGRGLGRLGPAGHGGERRARLHCAVPVHADRVLERSRRRPLPRGLLRALSGRLAPRRLRAA